MFIIRLGNERRQPRSLLANLAMLYGATCNIYGSTKSWDREGNWQPNTTNPNHGKPTSINFVWSFSICIENPQLKWVGRCCLKVEKSPNGSLQGPKIMSKVSSWLYFYWQFVAYSLGFKYDAINSYKIYYSLQKQHKNGHFWAFRVGIHFDRCSAMKLF